MSAQIINTSGYRFVALSSLIRVKEFFLRLMHRCQLKGTVLLSHEGVNILVAGAREAVDAMYEALAQDSRFDNIDFKESVSDFVPFQKAVVKIKPEIITMGDESVQPVQAQAKHLSAKALQNWLDEKKTFTLLDTRNDYEIEFGTFKQAVDLKLKNFREFPEAAKQQLSAATKKQPLVMFCTGGVRCEKAALALEQQGFEDVYQLDGGVLKYFETCHGAHWQGDCFVFDERVALDARLQPTGAVQCKVCAHPVSVEAQTLASYQPGISCSHCFPSKQPNELRGENHESI